MTTNNQVNAIANREFGRQDSPPANYFIALLTSTPNLNGTGITEVSTAGTGYARQSLANTKTALTVANNGQVSNVAGMEFPAAITNWGTVTDVAVFDALTGGNLQYFSTHGIPKPFGAGDIAFFDISDILFQVQNLEV